jgi:hypothetical protein
MEGPPLRIDYSDFSIIGIPDRVDEHPEGLFVIDFKTSSSLPKGSEMVEQGYRLQLPFYALAVQKTFGKDAVGVQFVELNRAAGRSRGIFFSQYNGDEPGKITDFSKRNSSLLSMSPQDAWVRIEEHLTKHAQDYLNGIFEAKPKKPDECQTCRMNDLCGRRRRGDSQGESDGAMDES